jgi:hypothetical protein
MSNAQVVKAIRDYETAKAADAACKKHAKAAAEELRTLEGEVIALLSEAQADADAGVSLLVDGRNYSIGQRSHWSIPAPLRDSAHAALRGLGLGGILKEVVDPRALTSTLEAIREEHDGIMPEAIRDIGAECYTETVLYSRKK